MNRFAIVDGGCVENVIVAESPDVFSADPWPALFAGHQFVPLSDGQPCGPGWLHADGTFTAPE